MEMDEAKKKKNSKQRKTNQKKEDYNWFFAPLFYFIFIKIIPFLLFITIKKNKQLARGKSGQNPLIIFYHYFFYQNNHFYFPHNKKSDWPW